MNYHPGPSTPTTCVSFQTEVGRFIFSTKQTFLKARAMLTKTNYTKFLFVFILYLGINLLIIKIRSSNYIHENVMKILKNRAMIGNKSKSCTASVVQNKEINIEDQSVKAKKSKISIDLTDNEITLEQIKVTCAENNLTTKVIKRNFLYSSKHHGLYCWIRKVASTSFTKIFSDMNDRMVSQNYYREIDFLAPKTSRLLKDLIDDDQVFKFLVVRHPFERLVSAYRDRIEDNSRYTAQSWIYAPKIFHLTRPNLFNSPGPVANSLNEIFYEDNRLKLIPSFKEFVQWLLQQDSSKDDPHWNQYYKQCALCSVQYDFILKLDNFTKNEVDYVFSQIDFSNGLDLVKLEETRNGNTNFDVTCNYFKNLSHEAIVNLYDKYRIDFDMFNYEFDKYFECIEGDR